MRNLSYPAAFLRLARLGVLVCGLAAGSANANLVSNAGFEAGLAGWGLLGAAQLVLVNDLSGKALFVSKRASATDGLRQDMQAGLSAMGSGQTVVSRATIKLAQPASVRLYLTVSDASGSRNLLLAESVVRISNQPMLIQGINPIAWQGNLASARFYLEVGQLAEGVFPDYTLDNLFIERDSDADGLSDSEETAFGTDPTKTDTDNDGMPDGWELANGFNPLANDAGLDSDGDGFTNLQEYGAATNPKDASSYPGKPINAKLDVRAREVLKYLALLPSQANNRVIAGQHVSDAAATDIQGYDYNITALEQGTGKKLGMVELQYEGTTPSIQYQIAAVNLVAESAWKQGKLVEIKWNPYIPWNNKSFNDTASFPLVDIAGMLAQNSPANQQAMATFNVYLDTVAGGLDELQKKNVVVLWRFMSEMNGSWFWWGHRPQAEYVALWRYIYDYLTNTRQLNNLLWVYESDSGVHGRMPSDYYFPGADVVDVVGHNFYSDTWDMPYDLNTLYRQYGKVYAIPQAGSASHSPVRAARFGWDNLTIISGIKARHPRTSYFCVWNSFPQWPNGAEYVAIVDEQNAVALLNDPWVVTADEIPDFTHLIPVVQGWNLLGNGGGTILDVANSFSDSTKVISVWKWNRIGGRWTFYSPSFTSQQLAEYTGSKGMEILSSINPGDGFWLNATQIFNLALPTGAPVTATAMRDLLLTGWNLVTIGETKTPSAVNLELSLTPPATGVIPSNITTLWAWDSAQAKWYFYAPSLDAQGGNVLSNYISNNGYLDFTSVSKSLGPGVGFWVNKP